MTPDSSAAVRAVRSVSFAAHASRTGIADLGVVATASPIPVVANASEGLMSDGDGARLIAVTPDEGAQLANHGIEVGEYALVAGDRLRAIALEDVSFGLKCPPSRYAGFRWQTVCVTAGAHLDANALDREAFAIPHVERTVGAQISHDDSSTDDGNVGNLAWGLVVTATQIHVAMGGVAEPDRLLAE